MIRISALVNGMFLCVCVAAVLVGVTAIEEPVGIWISLTAIIAVFLYQAFKSQVGSRNFAVDKRSGKLFAPGEIVVHFRRVFYSPHKGSFEFKPEEDGRVLLVEYEIPDFGAFRLTGELVSAGITLPKYIEQQLQSCLSGAGGDCADGVQSKLNGVREDLLEKGVAVKMTLERRETLVEVG